MLNQARHRRPLRQVKATSYPEAGAPPPATGLLVADLTRPRNAAAQVRNRFGRAISLDVIERSLLLAHNGSMRAICDLSRETIDTDPNLASVLGKRMRPLSSLPVDVSPAEGPGIDPDKAEFYSTVVRQTFDAIDGFSSMIGRMAWALWDGRACEELAWVDIVNGPSHARYGQLRMAVRSSEWVHPRRLSFGRERELRIIDDGASYAGGFQNYGLDVRSIPYKFLWWLPQLFGDYPEREGIATRAMYWSFFKRYGARERMILCELFGKPWRWIEQPVEAGANAKDLADAEKIADSLGATFTARMPRGLKLHFERPDHDDGSIHQSIIKDSDEQITKLILGQVGTTQGVAAGLNSNLGEVMSGEQGDILVADAGMLSEPAERLGDYIIAVNFGASETLHAPKVALRVAKPRNPEKEQGRLKGALDAGLSIKVDEAYEVMGFSQPAKGDTVVRVEQPPAIYGIPQQPRAVIVYPPGMAPTSGGELLLPPDAPPGDATPPTDGNQGSAQSLADLLTTAGIIASGMRAHQATLHAQCEHGVMCVAQTTQPETANGSPETILKRGQSEANRVVLRIVEAFESAVQGQNTVRGIVSALARARASIDTRPLGRALERRMVHAIALGAVDVDWEVQSEENVPEVAAAPRTIDFSALGFDQMEKTFKARNIMPRALFDKLSARAKQRAFTIAGVTTDQALATIHDELSRQVGAGADLSVFKKFVRKRMESSGFVATLKDLGNGQKALSASHTETVFRTNVLSAYNGGRAEQMRQPEVAARRPVWEIRAVDDDHARATHRSANGVMLLASDPFWERAYPPFGYNCRCRVVSRGPSFLSSVVDGSTLVGLPDEGFASGISSLISPTP